ncbi:TPA: hypothetical protein SMT94_000629 [Proteus mirabilis]
MFKAFHPEKDILINDKEYIEFTLERGYQIVKGAPKARCPICNQEMNLIAGKNKDNGHFRHRENSCCPTIEINNERYLYLFRGDRNDEVQIENKDFTKRNIRNIYSKVKEITPFLDYQEFMEILKEARRINIYGYAKLNPAYLPYIFVTLINFLPNKSYKKQRKLKFIFFYKSGINSIDELWINRGDLSKLFRISYQNNTAKKITRININTDYLNENNEFLTDKQIEYLNKFI